jgi:Flp pilus assembly pilin Flp
MDPYGQSGQSTIEWLALMAMLVAVAGVLVATVPSIGDTIVGAFEKLINAVTG